MELVGQLLKIDNYKMLGKIYAYTPAVDLSVPEAGPVRVGVHVLNLVPVDGLHGMPLHLQPRGRVLVFVVVVYF